MIYYLVTSANFYTTTAYLKTWGKDLATHLELLFYEQLPTTKQLPAGTYIFSDIERLSSSDAELVAQIWDSLSHAGNGLRLLNHPTRSMRRYELLRTLYERGLNRFNIYHLTELRTPLSFPVFIRGENDHGGSLTPLLHTREELEAAINALDQEGKSRHDKVIVEFCDTSDANRIFRKYSAFIVGDQIIPTHIFFSANWMAKVEAAEQCLNKAMLLEERRFVEENPHADALRQIARLARIDYGRIDYALLDNQIQVWEINTNPMLPRLSYGGDARQPVLQCSTQRLNAALAAIDCHVCARIQVPPSVVQGRAKRFGKLLLECIPAKYRPYARRRLKDLQKRGLALLPLAKH
jgi:hypothetical protein